LQLKSDKSLEDLARMFNPVISGWVNYCVPQSTEGEFIVN
jgi:hypothetical protein